MPSVRVEAALGGLPKLKGTIMTTIAKLTKQKDGSFIGTLSTISVPARKIALVPVESDSPKAPIYRVLLEDMEIGAAWSRQAKSGNEYLGYAEVFYTRSHYYRLDEKVSKRSPARRKVRRPK
jgi:Protein of unknown function (DUF736)